MVVEPAASVAFTVSANVFANVFKSPACVGLPLSDASVTLRTVSKPFRLPSEICAVMSFPLASLMTATGGALGNGDPAGELKLRFS